MSTYARLLVYSCVRHARLTSQRSSGTARATRPISATKRRRPFVSIVGRCPSDREAGPAAAESEARRSVRVKRPGEALHNKQRTRESGTHTAFTMRRLQSAVVASLFWIIVCLTPQVSIQLFAFVSDFIFAPQPSTPSSHRRAIVTLTLSLHL